MSYQDALIESTLYSETCLRIMRVNSTCQYRLWRYCARCSRWTATLDHELGAVMTASANEALNERLNRVSPNKGMILTFFQRTIPDSYSVSCQLWGWLQSSGRRSLSYWLATYVDRSQTVELSVCSTKGSYPQRVDRIHREDWYKQGIFELKDALHYRWSMTMFALQLAILRLSDAINW